MTTTPTTPMPSAGPPQFDPHNPKAAAKAAKAYAKATRPWYKKKRFLLPIALIIIIMISVSANGGSASSPTSGTKDESASVPTTDKSADDAPKTDEGTKPSVSLPKQNGDWRLDTLQFKDDGLGDFGGVARITYTGDDSNGGNNLFTITVFDKSGKNILATINGSASDVKPGQTVTTQLISSDKYKAGKHPFTFQNDL